ncbi:MAG: Stp1/IreP family PP2C-type Ser/Thr phosphatase [Heliobacteriaceae bacterium]|nr:Stp1/IreP family PP2C-type Ser/Thr phosphatase [Heliobacteriaceae bacterium]MDD4586985.1 Stp1/IreP family PP2C-type Ser/Thr phosphatase [Heliobacteriaceae bacterium]
MKVIARTDVGRVRRKNEDSYFVDLDRRLFLVADGMGGHEAGEVASSLAVEAFAANAGWRISGRDAVTVMAEACREANRLVYDQSCQNPRWAGMGTTLTAAWFTDTGLIIAHVGDSRAYMYRDDTMCLLTRDHSFVQEMVRKGQLTEAEALAHPQRNVITRALGTREEVPVDIFVVDRIPGGILLLCTDGLSNNVPVAEITAMIRAARQEPDQEKAMARAADELLSRALERGGQDNITFLIIWQAESEGRKK